MARSVTNHTIRRDADALFSRARRNRKLKLACNERLLGQNAARDRFQPVKPIPPLSGQRARRAAAADPVKDSSC